MPEMPESRGVVLAYTNPLKRRAANAVLQVHQMQARLARVQISLFLVRKILINLKEQIKILSPKEIFNASHMKNLDDEDEIQVSDFSFHNFCNVCSIS